MLADSLSAWLDEPRSFHVICEARGADGHAQFLQGASLSLSRHGVALILPRGLRRHDLIRLILQHPRTRVSCQRGARVSQRRRHGFGWIVGCQFQEPLTERELEQFVKGEEDEHRGGEQVA